MEIDRKLFEQVRLRADRAIKETNLELEARITDDERDLDRQSFERVLRYLTRTKKEDTQTVSLDIGMGAHRVTIDDEDIISEYCSNHKSVSLTQMYEQSSDSICVMRKEPVQKKVDILEYNVIVWLKLETDIQDPTEPLKAMAAAGRLLNFRLKRRHSFLTADGAFRIDCTTVKGAVGAKSVTALATVKETFEIEVELVDASKLSVSQGSSRDNTVASQMLNHITELLMVIRDQKEGKLLRNSDKGRVKGEFTRLTQTRIVMPKPVTLERGNLLEETPDNFSVRDDGPAGRYTVTDKADGTRVLLFFDSSGRGFFVDDRGNVSRTGITAISAASSVLDGELVKRSRIGSPINLFLVFDVYWFRGKDVRKLPLVDLDGPDGEAETRMRLMEPSGALGAALSTATDPFVRPKTFVPLREAKRLYTESVGPGGPEYDVDGLILTPEKMAVFQDKPGQPPKPKNSAWQRVFKWKPPKDNSIDFRVQFDKTSAGDIAMFSGQIRARLQVGVQDVANRAVDPYQILSGVALEKLMLFRAFEAPEYGLRHSGDPNSTGAGYFVHPGRELPRCDHPPNDTVLDGSIVEFSWDLRAGAWKPLRVRHDKTFPNKYETAISVWRSIAYPIELDDIVSPEGITDAGAGAKDDIYFDEVTAGDGAATAAMRRFHRSWIIDRLLCAKAADFIRKEAAGNKNVDIRLLDLACGRGGDINSWISNKIKTVVGVDLFEDNLVGQTKVAAYARFAKVRDSKRAADLDPKYAFVPMDASKKVGNDAVEDISNPALKKIAAALWRSPKYKPDPKLAAYDGLATLPFDVVSCQLAAHYFFESESKLDAFLDNVADNLRQGGVFIGTCTDGNATVSALSAAEHDAVAGTAIESHDPAGNLIWRIEKRFDNAKAGDVFGKAVAVYIETINKVNIEYLVDFGVMTDKLMQRGLRLLNSDELQKYGLRDSSALFSSVYADNDWKTMATDSSAPFLASVASMVMDMTQDLKTFSFLNRYFVFIKS